MSRKALVGSAVAIAAIAAIGAGAGWVWPLLRAELRTRIEIDLVDARDQRIERALVRFQDEDGRAITTRELADFRWLGVGAAPGEPGWGREVARAHVLAFGCERDADVVVDEQTHGSRFGRFAPHPVPLTHVYVLQGEVRCPDPRTTTERGIELARLVEDLSAGEPWSYGAASELVRIGPVGVAVLPQLLAILETTSDKALRVSLLRALGEMGSAAAPAIPLLTRVLDDPEPSLRRIAATSLEGIGAASPGVVPALAAAARRDSDRHVQEHELRILGRMGPEARAAEDDLVAILEDESEEDAVRRSAFSTLGKLDTPTATNAQRRYAAVHPILW